MFFILHPEQVARSVTGNGNLQQLRGGGDLSNKGLVHGQSQSGETIQYALHYATERFTK